MHLGNADARNSIDVLTEVRDGRAVFGERGDLDGRLVGRFSGNGRSAFGAVPTPDDEARSGGGGGLEQSDRLLVADPVALAADLRVVRNQLLSGRGVGDAVDGEVVAE